MNLEVRQAVESVIEQAQVPGIVLAAARGDGPAELLAVGADAADQPLAEDSLFTVASISKLAAALAVLRLVERGSLRLDDPLASHLPEAAAARDGVTLRRLLAHTSGLPGDLASETAPYRPGLGWPALAEACLRTEPERGPAERVQYSNVGYGLLALIVERKTGCRFANALDELVLGPLGAEAYLGTEPPRAPARLADVRSEHVGTELEPFNSTFWRSLAMPWGGLVTNAAGALALVRVFRGLPAGFLSDELRAEATRDQADGLGGGFFPPMIWHRSPWGLGPELRGEKSPHWAPAEASPASFGHAGASGCLAWADPVADVAWAMLGARTADNGWIGRHGARVGAALYPQGPEPR